jgi:membrane-anchored mycosin MYCP
MRASRRRTAHAAAVGLIIAALSGTPPAHALTPPSVHIDRLPAPAPPAPAQPTEQRAMCTIATESRSRAAGINPLRALGLESAWQLTRGEGQRIAVIDTGVTRHPRLAHLEGGGDYVSAGDGTQDCDGHGTIVAGIIAAAPESGDPLGFAGVAPGATVLTIRQASTKFAPVADPSATGVGDVDTMAMAVRTAADLGATVINISSVACGPGPLDDRALGAALAYAVDTKDVVVVAAAGNVGGVSQCPKQAEARDLNWDDATVAVSPAWYDDYVLTVGSVGPGGAASAFSLAGPWVDVAAPGEGMVSLNPGGHGLADTLPAFDREQPISGTSYAAPVVSGVAALVRSRFPDLTAREVMQRIEATAHPLADGWNPIVGNGTVDPLAAVSTDPPTGAPAPTPTAAQRAIEQPPAVVPTDNRPRDAALRGVGICAALSAATLAAIAGWRRLRLRGGLRGANVTDSHR